MIYKQGDLVKLPPFKATNYSPTRRVLGVLGKFLLLESDLGRVDHVLTVHAIEASKVKLVTDKAKAGQIYVSRQAPLLRWIGMADGRLYDISTGGKNIIPYDPALHEETIA